MAAGPASGALWGRLTERLMRRPALTLSVGVVLFVALALAQLGTSLSGFGGQTSGPTGADSTTGTAVIAAHYPSANQNPAQVLFRFPQSVWNDPNSLATAEQGLKNISSIQTVLGPLDPNGVPLTVAQLTQLHSELGNPQTLPAAPPPRGQAAAHPGSVIA